MAMTKARRAENDARIMHNLESIKNFGPLYDLAITRFEWDGLPETVNKRFLERVLNNEGDIIAFNDPDLGGLVLPAAGMGPRDVYGIPTWYNVWGYNGYHNKIPADQCVRILNNNMHLSSVPIIEMFARNLTNLDEMLNTNIETSKRPFIIQCTEEQRSTIMQMLNDVHNNKWVVLGDKNLDAGDINILQTGAVFQGQEIISVYNALFNRYLTLMGYENNPNQDKRERLIASEATANYGLVEGMRNAGLVPRQQAAIEMREKLGWTNASVKFRSEVPSMLNMPEIAQAQAGLIETEVESNEETV